MTYDNDRSTSEDISKVRRTSLARTLARACVLRMVRPIYFSSITYQTRNQDFGQNTQ